MRSLFFIAIFISQLSWAALEFESKLVEVHAAADAEEIAVDFNFKNTGDKAVNISHVDPDCDCNAIMVKGGKLSYQPGESGQIRSIFKIGNNRGVVNQSTAIWLEGDPKDKPSIHLVSRIHVPKVINMTPRSLKWDTGAKLERKAVEVTMQHEHAIHVTKTSSTNSNFELEVVEKGKQYIVWVTPKSTERPGIGVVAVETDSPVKNQKTEQVFAMVQKPK